MADRGKVFLYEFDDKEYTLSREQADEVDAYSSQEPDDAKYNKWFRDYVKSNNISPRSDASNSKYWSRLGSSYQDSTARNAMIQRAVTTLVRVASPEIKATDVSFSSGPTSRVNLNSKQVILPAGPIEGKDIHKDIDAVAGFAVHEAYHLNDSTNVLKPYLSDIDSGNTTGMLANLLEDFRINELGNNSNPGFEHYLDETMDYLYNSTKEKYKLPDEWPSMVGREATAREDVAGEQLAAIIAPLQYAKHVGSGSDKPYYHKIQKADEIIKEYVAHGKASTSNDLRQAINKMKALLDVIVDGSSQQKCKSPVPMSIESGIGDDKGLEGEDAADKVAAAAAADMTQGNLKKNEFARGAGIGDETVTIVRPMIDMGPVRIGKVDGDIVKADAALRLTKTRERNEDRYMRSGDLDEDELHRLFLGDDRVFINVTEEVEEEAAVYMCVDVSGSMAYGRIEDASKMAWLLAHSMSKKKHVKTKVFAHTSQVSVMGIGFPMGASGTVIYRVHEKGEDFKRLNWLLNFDMGGTPDEVALAVLGKEILQEEVPNKYIIMLNDGQPNDPDAVANITKALDRKGIYVIQIGLAGSLRRQVQAYMYKYFVTYRNVEQTVKDLAKILDKVR